MKAIGKILFSFRLTAILFIVFAVSIGVATFIENDFGSETARAHIYNASWFELLFLLATINMIGNMLLHRVYRKGKLSIMLFHLAFILILIGAGVTRYAGFTGIMHIREGSQSSLVLSDEAHLNVQVLDNEGTSRRSGKIYLSAINNPRNLLRVKSNRTRISIRYLDHMDNARPVLSPSVDGKAAVLLVSSSSYGRDQTVMYDSESRWIGGQLFHFNREAEDGVQVYNRNGSLFFRAPFPVVVLRMGDASNDTLEQDTEHDFQPMFVYGFGGTSVVLSDFQSHATILAVRTEEGEGNGKTALSLRLQTNHDTKDITIWGGKGLQGEPRQVKLGNTELFISYGSQTKVLPFSLYLEDFILERYPGSQSPSSFESRVILRDEARRVDAPHRIYMNNILNHAGYRFYQSSYDSDEMGTVLSVNQDPWGTLLSYLGYFFLFLGILLSLFNPNSRLRTVSKQLASAAGSMTGMVLLLITALSIIPFHKVSADGDSPNYIVPSSHIHAFSEVLVQGHQGRIKPMNTWHSPRTIHSVYTGEDSLFASSITQLYLEAVTAGMETGDWSRADEYLGYIKVFQERMGGEIIPSRFKQKTEIFYNRIALFERLARFYLAIGFILLLIQLVNVLGKKIRFTWVRRVLVIHLLVALGVHSTGLALRWYISWHAPWSNGYESLIYISWASMLAGAVFSRRTSTPLAATAVLSWMILHTAHLSWMDPQVTNLVPVLKSYWLTIHVAVIASSYGFLALAALMGFLNLVLMALQNGKNRLQASVSIHSLSSISEMTIIAGLGLLTIGTFLGAIWANESWGRYWAWDAKESWALITIFVYAFIAHMRFVPGLKHIYAFNLASLLGFASVLMTYFGVNYYLSGMHSYAAGDPVPVPNFVWYTVAVIAFTAIAAYLREKNKTKCQNSL